VSSAPQFYETRVLLTSPQEVTKWLWIMTSPPTVPEPETVSAAWIEGREPVTERDEAPVDVGETVTDQYEQLISEASRVFPIPADRLDEALQLLIETSDRSRRSALAKYRYWFGPESAREPLRRAHDARQRELDRQRKLDRRRYDEGYELEDAERLELYVPRGAAYSLAPPPEYEFARQAMTFDIVPVEASPLTKTSIAKAAAESGTLAICFFAGGPVLCIVGSVGLIAVRALSKVGSALWEGAEPEVAEFGGDVTATLLDAIRARLGIQRRKR
jgi:hypothetical protein